MKTFIASFILLTVLTTPILAPAQETEPATEAKVVLTAPSVSRIGELVRFDASASVADSLEWLLVPQSCPDFEVYDNGRKAVFSARMEGEYRFIVACAKDGTVDVVTHVVKVVGPPPMPTTDSLSEWIPFWNWAEMLPKEECDLLAASFEAVAALSHELDTPEKWMEMTAKANRNALGDRLEAWKPMLNKIGAALKKKAESGALTTPEDHEKAWLEIAQGLRNC